MDRRSFLGMLCAPFVALVLPWKRSIPLAEVFQNVRVSEWGFRIDSSYDGETGESHGFLGVIDGQVVG